MASWDNRVKAVLILINESLQTSEGILWTNLIEEVRCYSHIYLKGWMLTGNGLVT